MTDPFAATTVMTPAELTRFVAKLTISDECWVWRACRDAKGYGLFFLNRRSCRAHRVMYELMVGPIPSNLQIDHLCRNPSCVRPSHLEVVDPSVNYSRSLPYRAVRITCILGHPLDGVQYNGHRRCITCSREYQRTYYFQRRPSEVQDQRRADRQLIRTLRSQGLTQHEIAASTGFAQSTVSRVLNDK